jgi:hypothetical protein
LLFVISSKLERVKSFAFCVCVFRFAFLRFAFCDLLNAPAMASKRSASRPLFFFYRPKPKIGVFVPFLAISAAYASQSRTESSQGPLRSFCGSRGKAPPSAASSVGDDSRFFALLGSAPQELNTVRPEAKLTC